MASGEGFLTEEQREILKIAPQNVEVLSSSPKSPTLRSPSALLSEHHVKAPLGGKASTAGIAVRHVRRTHSGKHIKIKKGKTLVHSFYLLEFWHSSKQILYVWAENYVFISWWDLLCLSILCQHLSLLFIYLFIFTVMGYLFNSISIWFISLFSHLSNSVCYHISVLSFFIDLSLYSWRGIEWWGIQGIK